MLFVILGFLFVLMLLYIVGYGSFNFWVINCVICVVIFFCDSLFKVIVIVKLCVG